jgi:hypothetical protein
MSRDLDELHASVDALERRLSERRPLGAAVAVGLGAVNEIGQRLSLRRVHARGA